MILHMRTPAHDRLTEVLLKRAADRTRQPLPSVPTADALAIRPIQLSLPQLHLLIFFTFCPILSTLAGLLHLP